MTINKTEIYGTTVLCGLIAGRFAASCVGLPPTGAAAIDFSRLGIAAVLCSVAQVVSAAMLAATVTLCITVRQHPQFSRHPQTVRHPLTGWHPHSRSTTHSQLRGNRLSEWLRTLHNISIDRQDILMTAAISAIFLCSFSCYLTDSLSQIVSAPWIERLATSDFVRRRLANLCNAIDDIGFSDRENNALVKALISGNRSSLSPTTTAAFRNSGASHILALSGLHFGVVYMVLNTLLKILGNSPAAERIRTAVTIVATACYAVITGAGPSVCRAFIFILLREISKTGHRDSSLRTILWSSFICQTALQPSAINSVSFQLSYMAIVGITYINPPLSRIYDIFVSLFHRPNSVDSSNIYGNGRGNNSDLQRDAGSDRNLYTNHDESTRITCDRNLHTNHDESIRIHDEGGLRDGKDEGNNGEPGKDKSLMKRLWQSLSVSLSCQIATAPLAWYHFRSLPQYFLIANLFALPAIGLIIPLSVVSIVLTVAGFPASFIIKADELLLDYVRWVLDTVAAM